MLRLALSLLIGGMLLTLLGCSAGMINSVVDHIADRIEEHENEANNSPVDEPDDSDDPDTTTPPEDEEDPEDTTQPSSIVGTWMRVAATVDGMPVAASAVTVEFHRDGTYIQYVQGGYDWYGEWWEEGRYTVSGNRLALFPTDSNDATLPMINRAGTFRITGDEMLVTSVDGGTRFSETYIRVEDARAAGAQTSSGIRLPLMAGETMLRAALAEGG